MKPEPPLDATAGSSSPNSVHHDFTGDQTASLAVIEAIAAVSGTDPVELPPLYDVINPDALNALFEPHERRTGSGLHVEFSYNGFDIVVREGPEVVVRLEDAPE
ncbi:HalOD1 output domain-containing protein [Natronorubrum sp. DTA7]|uniref:HalOD1 output domain-containing protein n=1 Tax=Natronorubrum sp. DTA7 TaxID=3447016 RepID=UPI003F86509E